MRAILIVLDSVGIGAAPDAERYGDWGADTLGHVFANSPTLTLPALFSLGLGEVLGGTGHDVHASHGRVRPASPGKDSISAHWEMAGVIRREEFTTYQKLPPRLVEAIEAAAGVEFLCKDGIACEPEALWREHAATGLPMLRLEDSTIEISAHESLIPRKRLLDIGRIVRRKADAHGIARVVTQVFTGKPGAGSKPSAYVPEPNGRHVSRHVYGALPPRTILNAIAETGLVVHGIGKIPDIFARSGITHSSHASTNSDALCLISPIWEQMHDGLIFANLPDFDRCGHARDVAGYAAALAEFDAWLGGFLKHVLSDDLLIITADHGNDPAFRGNSHTREELPLLMHYDGMRGSSGTRETLADIAATMAVYFQLKEKWPTGKSLLTPAKVRAHRHKHLH